MKGTKPIFIIISPGFAKDEKDSACLPSKQSFVLSLNKLYPELKIIILALEYPFSKKTYQWHGNTVFCFNAWKKGKIKKLFIAFSAWRTLNKLKKQYNIIGIFSLWCTKSAWIGKRFADQNAIKHQIWILGQDAKKENKYVSRVKPKPAELIALSDFAANEFNKNHQILPSHIIPPGIDPLQFSEKIPLKDIDILGAGSLIALKQYDLFIQIIFEVKKTFPDIKVVLCGKGPEEAQLKKLMATLELENNVVFVGQLAHTDVLTLMQRTKIFLHPSVYEGFGVVCIEALYAGADVVSFCKPMNDAIPHWHIAENKNDMQQKVMSLLQKNNIEHDTVMPFTMDGSTKKIMQLFDYKKRSNLSKTITLQQHY